MIDLDEILDAEQAAKWLKMSTETLLSKSRGKRAMIPGFWLNSRVLRFHPRTVVSVLAARAGVSPEIIAASFGIQAK